MKRPDLGVSLVILYVVGGLVMAVGLTVVSMIPERADRTGGGTCLRFSNDYGKRDNELVSAKIVNATYCQQFSHRRTADGDRRFEWKEFTELAEVSGEE